jgi:hypothetical protein
VSVGPVCDGNVMLLAPADVDLPWTVDATAGLVHDFLVYIMHNGDANRVLIRFESRVWRMVLGLVNPNGTAANNCASDFENTADNIPNWVWTTQSVN